MIKTKIRPAAALAAMLLALIITFGGCSAAGELSYSDAYMDSSALPRAASDTQQAYTVLNDNMPEFSEEDLSADVFENYSELDSLGRCGQAFALLGRELMPDEERGSIGQVKPSGWHTVRYDDLISDKYLYNRCHLIGFQLAGENANEKNLITGTRYMNVEGMLPFENEVADYIRETGNHVLYRVSPIYEGDDLVARGVKMEAFSVEDSGAGVCFNVFVYNIQPGVVIDYATGESRRAAEPSAGDETSGTVQSEPRDYVINTNSGKFHLPECSSVDSIKEKNKEVFRGTREFLIEEGFEPCGSCRP